MRKEKYELYIGYDKDGEIMQYTVYRYITWFKLFTIVKIARTYLSHEPLETFSVIALPYTV